MRGLVVLVVGLVACSSSATHDVDKGDAASGGSGAGGSAAGGSGNASGSGGSGGAAGSGGPPTGGTAGVSGQSGGGAGGTGATGGTGTGGFGGITGDECNQITQRCGVCAGSKCGSVFDDCKLAQGCCAEALDCMKSHPDAAMCELGGPLSAEALALVNCADCCFDL